MVETTLLLDAERKKDVVNWKMRGADSIFIEANEKYSINLSAFTSQQYVSMRE